MRMRAGGLWHAGIAQVIVAMRHTDTLVISDAGLPVPGDVPVMDLGWSRGEPRLLPVLNAVLTELVIERATIAAEAADQEFLTGLRLALRDVPCERVSHEALKAACASSRAVIRTGEDTPFVNVILHAGVPFE